MPTAAKGDATITIDPVAMKTIELGLVGLSPLICNRPSQKALRELLLPRGKQNQAERASSLKHDPIEEFRASAYTLLGDDSPTLIAVMSSAIKGAMSTAALDLPGTKKAQIGRLVFVHGHYTPVWGVPELFMAVVRSADINHTPDVRTRVIIPQWAAKVRVSFVVPILRESSVANLLVAGGQTAGIGDWRPEKGKGSFGQFRVCDVDDPELNDLIATGGRAAQVAAMESPRPYDEETAELFSWFEKEVEARGRSGDRAGRNGSSRQGIALTV